MPSITDKLKAEERNERTVRLWPEGKFFKAYERSAYLFVTQVKPYEGRRRYVDVVGHDVVQIGFPQSVLDQLKLNQKKEDDGSVTLRMESAFDEQQFLLWRDSLPQTEMKQKQMKETKQNPVVVAAPPAAIKKPTVELKVAARIRSVNLAAKTPMQCMLLLSELQAMLNEDNGE